jgi:hypothetical protein
LYVVEKAQRDMNTIAQQGDIHAEAARQMDPAEPEDQDDIQDDMARMMDPPEESQGERRNAETGVGAV